MSVTLKGKSGEEYEFEGTYGYIDFLEGRSGVYAIFCKRNSTLSLIDVGEASQLRSRVESHERTECWQKNCGGIREYAAYYIEHGKKPSRMEVEQDIRKNYDLPCGEQ